MSNNEYSVDELVPPEWLNESFFQTAVSQFKKDDSIKVKNLSIRPGTKPGEHYASIMFRADVTYDTSDSVKNNIKLILKTMPFVEGVKKEMLQNTTAFKTEMRMYEEVLPVMQKLLRRINDPTIIAPTLVYQSNVPAPVIVFIDEGPNGFKPYETALNYDQVQVVIERIAKFHACSLYMNDNGIDMTSFNDCPYLKAEGRMDFVESFFLPNVKSAVSTIKEWEGCEEVIKVLDKHLPTFEQKVRDVFNDWNKQPYQVLVHGDFQYKNMISRNDGLKNEDFLLLDYQFCYWNTAAADVLALVCAVSDESVRKSHRKEVIQKYFDIFRETLVKLEYKGRIPRLLDLQMEMLRCGLLEYMFYLVFVPFQLIDFSKIDINKVMETMDFHAIGKHVFKTKEYQESFLKRITFLIEMGVFE